MEFENDVNFLNNEKEKKNKKSSIVEKEKWQMRNIRKKEKQKKFVCQFICRSQSFLNLYVSTSEKKTARLMIAIASQAEEHRKETFEKCQIYLGKVANKSSNSIDTQYSYENAEEKKRGKFVDDFMDFIVALIQRTDSVVSVVRLCIKSIHSP